MDKNLTYTAAIRRIEEIVAEIEDDACDIDRLAGLISEAQKLLAFCKKRLGEVETDVKKALEDGER